MTRAQPFLDLLVVGHGIDPAFDDLEAGLAVSVRDSRSADWTGATRFSPAAPPLRPPRRVARTANPVVDATLSGSRDAVAPDTVYSYRLRMDVLESAS